MLRSRILHLATVSALAVAAGVLPACARSQQTLSGTVMGRTAEVDAPVLPAVLPDVSVALEEQSGIALRTPQTVSVSPVAASTSLGKAVRVESVSAEVGDRVEAGDVIARLEAASLRAHLSAAQATARRAAANADLVREKRSDLRSTRSDVTEQRSDVESLIAELQATRSLLVGQLAQARAALAQVEALRERMSRRPTGGAPPTLPPGVTPPRPPSLPDPAQLRAGIARLDAGIKQIDAGLARARAGLARLEDAQATIAEAQEQLGTVVQLADIAAAAARVGAELAAAQVELATVRAPVSGILIASPKPGAVVAAGAPLALIRESGPAHIEVWVPTEEDVTLALGDQVLVSADSFPGRTFNATVTRLGEAAEFPPTSMATDFVHMLRAFRYEITLEAAAPLPDGTPVDVTETDR